MAFGLAARLRKPTLPLLKGVPPGASGLTSSAASPPAVRHTNERRAAPCVGAL